MLIADYHNHPQAHRTDLPYSEQVLQPWADKAKEIGLKDIALTDHDRYKAGIDFGEIEKLRERNPGINFRSGIEIDNDPETGLEGHKWVEKNWDNLDFVLGSVHFIDDFPFDRAHHIKEYENWDINDLYRRYYKELQRIAKTGLVSSMAHLDLIKIFKFFPTEDMTELYHETLDLIKEQDLSMEISTAGFKKPIGIQYPDVELIKMAKDKGIRFTIASDAHAAKDLGGNYDKLETILRDLDIKEIAIYEKHERKLISPYA